jgi:hypothetical protein
MDNQSDGKFSHVVFTHMNHFEMTLFNLTSDSACGKIVPNFRTHGLLKHLSMKEGSLFVLFCLYL